MLDSALQDQGLFSRIGSDISNHIRSINDIGQSGDNLASRMYQGGVQGLAAVGDTLAEPVKSLASVTPQAVKDYIKTDPLVMGANAAISGIANSGIADKARSALQELQASHPEAARNISATGTLLSNAALLIPEAAAAQGVGDALPAITAAAKDTAANALEKVPALDQALGKTIRPTAADLKTSSQTSYGDAANTGGWVGSKITDDLIDRADSFTEKDPMAAAINGESPLKGISDSLQPFKGQIMSLDRAFAVDRALTDKLNNSAFTDKNGVLNSYGRQVLDLKSQLRDQLLNAADNGLVAGGNEGLAAYRSAVKDWAAKSQMDEIQRIIDRAEYTDNPATSLKAGFRNIAANPGRLSKFPAEVQGAIKRAASSGDIANILRTELGSRLISGMVGTATGAAGGMLGGPIGSAVGGVIGGVGGMIGSGFARNAAESMQMGRVNGVLDAIAAQSSLPSRVVPKSELLRSPNSPIGQALKGR